MGLSILKIYKAFTKQKMYLFVLLPETEKSELILNIPLECDEEWQEEIQHEDTNYDEMSMT